MDADCYNPRTLPMMDAPRTDTHLWRTNSMADETRNQIHCMKIKKIEQQYNPNN